MDADMLLAAVRIILVLAGFVSIPVHAQSVQAGLEAAVKWKWWPLPSEEKDCGFQLAEPILPPAPAPADGSAMEKKQSLAPAGTSIAPGNYEVKRGDALAIIARKSGVPVGQIKKFNVLAKDTIRIGQILKIPTAAEAIALAPPAPVPKTPAPPAAPVVSKKHRKLPAKAEVEPEIDYIAEATLLQVFLDRENFSSGPIDGIESTAWQSLSAIYRILHEDLPTPEALRAKAVAVVGEPFAAYKLKRSDFRFIAPSKPVAVSPPVVAHPKGRGAKAAPVPKAPARPPVTYEDIVEAKYSAYRSPWEFVAERFHCDESFLRSLNPNIKITPTADMDFKVPNVTPFEIEKCFESPLRPKADPAKPVTAAVVEMSRLEIYRGGKLVAMMPLSKARPGLRGRGTWTILNAIAGPRLATRHEPAATSKAAAVPEVAAPSPEHAPGQAEEQTIAAGPRNPVGVFWINLAKANSATPLSYGLHGSSIPGRTKESLGGLRLANWDIARAARMLPEGTPLIWK